MDIKTFLILTHIIGTVIGVGGATLAEVFIIKALKDGVIDPVESSFLKSTYTAMRVGLFLLVLSGFGFFLYFRIEGSEDLLYDEKIWAKMTIVIILLVNAILLSVRKVPLWLGSAISLTSWYTALVLGVWHSLSASFFNILMWYVIIIFVVAGILHIIKKFYYKKQ